MKEGLYGSFVTLRRAGLGFGVETGSCKTADVAGRAVGTERRGVTSGVDPVRKGRAEGRAGPGTKVGGAIVKLCLCGGQIEFMRDLGSGGGGARTGAQRGVGVLDLKGASCRRLGGRNPPGAGDGVAKG